MYVYCVAYSILSVAETKRHGSRIFLERWILWGDVPLTSSPMAFSLWQMAELNCKPCVMSPYAQQLHHGTIFCIFSFNKCKWSFKKSSWYFPLQMCFVLTIICAVFWVHFDDGTLLVACCPSHFTFVCICHQVIATNRQIDFRTRKITFQCLSYKEEEQKTFSIKKCKFVNWYITVPLFRCQSLGISCTVEEDAFLTMIWKTQPFFNGSDTWAVCLHGAIKSKWSPMLDNSIED